MVVNSMSYATYERYKDSGVDWLGEIPSTWTTRKLKHIVKIHKRIIGHEGIDVLSITQRGIVVKDITSGAGQLAMDYSKYQIVEIGDFAMNHMDLLTGYVDISKFEGVVSPDYRVFKNESKEINDDYLLKIFQIGYNQKIFYKYGQGVSMLGRWRLPAENFNLFSVPIPSTEEQTKIIEFLDQKTAQIDQAIALKQQQIEKLNEYKQIVIQNAVTKGLNPNAPMKNSGVEWIGDIPEHWEVKKLKHFGVIKSGDSVINSNLTDEGLYEVYGGNGFMGFYNKFNIDKESIIIGRVGALCGNVRYIKEKKWITDNALIFKLNSKFKDYEYLALVLEAGNLNRLNTSNAQPLITGTKVVNFSIPIPCEKERCEILDVIKSFSTKYSQAITNYQTQIHRLKEYKNILINQAVTGKIKI